MSKIIVAPNEVLGKITVPFDFSGKKGLFSLIKEMENTLLSASDPKGVGLAAPQIGKSVSIFITRPKEDSKTSVFINPEILESTKVKAVKKKRIKKLEGCLSLPNIWGEVLRAPSVTISYYNEKGEKKIKKFSGFMSTIVQHEMDHLNGILFPKRVLEQQGRLYESHKNKKGQDEFEELEI